MTPERRDELRRADDAVKHARYTLDRKNYMATIEAQERLIKHFQEHVVTDNSKTLMKAIKRISFLEESFQHKCDRVNELESLLAKTGEFLYWMDDFTDGSTSTSKLIAEIDAILPATEGDKNAHIND